MTVREAVEKHLRNKHAIVYTPTLWLTSADGFEEAAEWLTGEVEAVMALLTPPPASPLTHPVTPSDQPGYLPPPVSSTPPS